MVLADEEQEGKIQNGKELRAGIDIKSTWMARAETAKKVAKKFPGILANKTSVTNAEVPVSRYFTWKISYSFCVNHTHRSQEPRSLLVSTTIQTYNGITQKDDQ